jgi:flagellin
MRLNHNLASLNIYREHTKNIRAQSGAMNRISSGNRVNRASDDPNKLSQSERLRLQIRGLQMAQRNVQDGASMLQTADGALDSVTSMLHRIKELTVQTGRGVNEEDKKVIQLEIEQMLKGIDDTIKNNEFNGVKLLHNENSSFSEIKYLQMPSGANVDDMIKIPTYDLTVSKLTNVEGTLSLADIDVVSVGGRDKALAIIDGALDTVLSVRSKYGALANRFQSSYENIAVTAESLVRSESDMRDADIGEEIIKLTKHSLLIESGHALLAQTNRFPQEILRILENVRR